MEPSDRAEGEQFCSPNQSEIESYVLTGGEGGEGRGGVSKHHLLKVKLVSVLLVVVVCLTGGGRYQSITERQRLIINNIITFTFNTLRPPDYN